MPGVRTYINENNFYPFIKNNYEDFNLYNIEYIEKIKKEFFSTYGNNLSKCKAKECFNKLLNSKYSLFATKVSIKYWNLMGYFNKNEIIVKLKKYKKDCHISIDEFNKKVSELIVNINLDNKERIEELKNNIYKEELCLGVVEFNKRLNDEIKKFGKAGTSLKVEYWLFRGWNEKEAKNKISETQSNRSLRHVNYYIDKGYSEEEANRLVSNVQSKYSKMGKHCKDFWVSKGFSEEESIEIAHNYSQKCSVWNKQFWLNKGFSEEEAEQKILQYNPSSPIFLNYDNNYEKYKNKIKRWSDFAKVRWEKKEYRDKIINKIKDGTIKLSSKMEIELFNNLKTWYSNIKHEPYVVIIPDNFENAINLFFYTIDGYYVDEEGVILIECDSSIFHNDKKDEIRDNNILSIDKNVLGIIRIKDSFLKKIKLKKNLLDNAIQEIKNSEKNRIILS